MLDWIIQNELKPNDFMENILFNCIPLPLPLHLHVSPSPAKREKLFSFPFWVKNANKFPNLLLQIKRTTISKHPTLTGETNIKVGHSYSMYTYNLNRLKSTERKKEKINAIWEWYVKCVVAVWWQLTSFVNWKKKCISAAVLSLSRFHSFNLKMNQNETTWLPS